MSLTLRPTERGNSSECVGCAWSNVIASHMWCRGAKRKHMDGNFCFWRPYISLFVVCDIVQKWNLLPMPWSYEMSDETFWAGVWFSYKKDLKMGCKNQNWKHRPVINLITCLTLYELENVNKNPPSLQFITHPQGGSTVEIHFPNRPTSDDLHNKSASQPVIPTRLRVAW
jgi:hypothetical protein